MINPITSIKGAFRFIHHFVNEKSNFDGLKELSISSKEKKGIDWLDLILEIWLRRRESSSKLMLHIKSELELS